MPNFWTISNIWHATRRLVNRKDKTNSKTGDIHSPENYWPISLTCICCKMLEDAISLHASNNLQTNNFVFPNQHGFRKGFSCGTQLFELTTEIHFTWTAAFKRTVSFLIFLKTDRVPHCQLIYKQASFRALPFFCQWLQRTYVRINEQRGTHQCRETGLNCQCK